MKVITGYLIDRTTGNGISGKAVEFNNLAGSPITTASTYAQSVSSVTASDGKFSGWFELSPGPVNVKVTASGSEFKVRKNDETAQIGAAWMSDLQRLGHAFNNAVLPGFLNQLAVTTPSGHNIVIATGAVVIDGILFSIENGPMTIAGTANSNAALNPRLDLVTLRQYKATAAGQLSGKQEVVVTLGTTQSVIPAVPTGSDFTDYPLAVVSTGYNAATKTVYRDMRTYTQNPTPEAPKIGMFGTGIDAYMGGGVAIDLSNNVKFTVTVTGLNPAYIYDGDFHMDGDVIFSAYPETNVVQILASIDNTEFYAGPVVDREVAVHNHVATGQTESFGGSRRITLSWPIAGVTGVTSYDIPVKMRRAYDPGSGGTTTLRYVTSSAILRKRV